MDAGSVGHRFKKFLRSEVGARMDQYNADVFWAVRNSLVHAFNTLDAKQLSQMGMNSIALAQRRVDETSLGPGWVVGSREGETATVYVDGVFQKLASSIERYHRSLYEGHASDLRSRFEAMFEKYGTIRIG